ncbi:MAG: RimK family alpha-L-glutamate ligase [Aureispira sp.]
MKKYNCLVLTDHKGHSAQNSLYALVRTMVQHQQCTQVQVASRANPQNKAFFEQQEGTTVQAITVGGNFDFDSSGQQFLPHTNKVDLRTVDFIFMRLPRPITDQFLNYLVQVAPQAIFVNNPKGIIETSTKAFLMQFPELCPPMRLCHSAQEIKEFATQFPIVLKPLREYGGKGIVRIEKDKVALGAAGEQSLETYLESIQEELTTNGYLAMKFLKNVSQGDKRILVVNGKILGASLRLPPPDSWLCNIAQGGASVSTTVTAEEEAMVARLMPALQAAGVVMFGMDTLTNDQGKRVLSEINTLSIGGFPQAAEQTGEPVVQFAIDGIIDYLNTKNNARSNN